MSSQFSSPSILVEVYESTRAGTSCILAVLTLLVYDYILSAGEEWTVIWGTGTIKPRVLYGMTRYSLIALFALNLSTGSSTSFCNVINWALLIVECVARMTPGVFSALRVYALSEDLWLAMVTFLLSLVGIVFGMIIGIIWTEVAILPPPANCVSFPTISLDLSLTHSGLSFKLDSCRHRRRHHYLEEDVSNVSKVSIRERPQLEELVLTCDSVRRVLVHAGHHVAEHSAYGPHWLICTRFHNSVETSSDNVGILRRYPIFRMARAM
ncbi:hypothetical protein C8Q74DRAFT_412099 [Fomes fomentarius]|nr:hypothetical protein C8Q74DRAFT_412099 [Fomes fomentarius]